jgi:phosphonoacetaldehyde hydrolase
MNLTSNDAQSGFARNTQHYSGTIKAAIFDWAGTTVDFGSRAPIQAFKRLFEDEGIDTTEAECRAPMGAEKREHIRQMLEMPNIRKQWLELKKAEPSETDIDRLYHAFVPVQIDIIKNTTALIPGCTQTISWLRDRGVKVGANTGYSVEMYEALADKSSNLGYTPDANVCATEVTKGRPYPYMAQAVMEKLGIREAQACIKVDDTETGIAEGLNAGMWTVAVTTSGNALGLSLDEWESLPKAEQARLAKQSEEKLRSANPHFLIDSIEALPETVERIESLMANGARP